MRLSSDTSFKILTRIRLDSSKESISAKRLGSARITSMMTRRSTLSWINLTELKTVRSTTLSSCQPPLISIHCSLKSESLRYLLPLMSITRTRSPRRTLQMLSPNSGGRFQIKNWKRSWGYTTPKPQDILIRRNLN